MSRFTFEEDEGYYNKVVRAKSLSVGDEVVFPTGMVGVVQQNDDKTGIVVGLSHGSGTVDFTHEEFVEFMCGAAQHEGTGASPAKDPLVKVYDVKVSHRSNNAVPTSVEFSQVFDEAARQGRKLDTCCQYSVDQGEGYVPEVHVLLAFRRIE